MKNISEKMEAAGARAAEKMEAAGAQAAEKMDAAEARAAEKVTARGERAAGLLYDNTNCPVRQVLDRIGDKWSSLVILHLGEFGMMRFNGLSNAIGDISQKMLTVTLRNLEADGLVSRKAFAEIPPRVEYELTKLGESLVPLIRELVTWADANMGAIKDNRTTYGAPVRGVRAAGIH
jgi:DNA-binding HxlR family transcriptional regulator